MEDREICENIVENGDCRGIYSCRNCPILCVPGSDEVQLSMQWLKDNPEENPEPLKSEMTLHDWFAGMALAGGSDPDRAEEYADDMMERREG